MTELAQEEMGVPHARELFVDGEWCTPATAKTFELVSPVTGQPFFTVAAAAEADVDRAVTAARRAFDTGPWPRMSPAERAGYLNRLADALDLRSRDLAHAWTRQMGIPFSMSLPHTSGGINFIRMYAALSSQVNWEKELPTIYPNCKGLLIAEPVGVVAAIAPWNGPLFLLTVKLAPALLAGCTAVIKPAPETPLEAFILSECAREAGFPAGVINLIPADNQVSNHLVLHPGVDKVSFTGSTAAGRKIASELGQRIGRYTLELGGKSPAIILDDYDMDAAAQNLAPTLTNLAGQFCTNLTRLLVPRRREQEFAEAMIASMSAIKVGDPYDPATQMGPLAGRRHFDRVAGYIQKGREQGAKLLMGGGRPKALPQGFFFEPTLFGGVDNRSTIAQEEIFGPVGCIIPYDSVDDAVRLANDTMYGLAGAVFTHDGKAAYEIARKVRTGTFAQNGLKFDFTISFGGFKQSGIGREGGLEGIKPYLELKTIILESETKPEAVAA